jgi:hypothetical protein
MEAMHAVWEKSHKTREEVILITTVEKWQCHKPPKINAENFLNIGDCTFK